MAEDEDHEPSAKERLYDEQIAPELLRLAKLCQENGLSIIAQVEWAPDQTARTAALAADSSFHMKLMHYTSQVRGNVDQLFFTLARDCRENRRPHSSIVMSQLGVPTTPPAAE